jgi:phosphate uptake regulator
MKRRVVLHGPATLTVSLPSQWVRTHHIQKGDELNVLEEGAILKISLDKEKSAVQKTRVDFSGLKKYAVNTILASLHKSGYDEIEVQFDDPSILKVIHERIYTMLIGYEIIDQTKHSCTLRSISSNEQQDFKNFLRRTFLVTLAMAEQSLTVFQEKSYDHFDDLLLLEQTNNRLSNYSQRLINKVSVTDYARQFYFVVIWLLESICDDMRSIIFFVRENKSRVLHPETLKVFAAVHKLLVEFYTFFFKYEDTMLDTIHKHLEEKESELQRIISSSQRSDAFVLMYLHNIIQRIHDALGSTAGINH